VGNGPLPSRASKKLLWMMHAASCVVVGEMLLRLLVSLVDTISHPHTHTPIHRCSSSSIAPPSTRIASTVSLASRLPFNHIIVKSSLL